MTPLPHVKTGWQDGQKTQRAYRNEAHEAAQLNPQCGRRRLPPAASHNEALQLVPPCCRVTTPYCRFVEIDCRCHV